MFVTHDIDEAIKMGDRIAILREGGVLAQYDTPREILTRPADDFVAQFVGRDRALKRLSLTTVAELTLLAPDGEDGAGPSRSASPAQEPGVSLQTTVHDALSQLLSAGGGPLPVSDGEGRLVGLLTLEQVQQLLCEDGARRALAKAS